MTVDYLGGLLDEDTYLIISKMPGWYVGKEGYMQRNFKKSDGNAQLCGCIDL